MSPLRGEARDMMKFSLAWPTAHWRQLPVLNRSTLSAQQLSDKRNSRYMADRNFLDSCIIMLSTNGYIQSMLAAKLILLH
ncbi:unnamed protein product [Toxocara canis]|uniref:Uncharacterized protein n=1 Tax=Toxocara canis TaxID=6265 RepID=A0A183UH50_TOXCA|nr:unnamed protein product [Toxocara canis]